MKIRIDYEKLADGQIEAHLTVIDQRDYPTQYLFSSSEDYPNKEGFVLRNSEQAFISKSFATSDDARSWAAEQLNKLRQELKKWRSVKVPSKENHEI